MESFDRDILDRANQYALGRGIRLEDRLGFGKDGTVWSTSRATAVKVFRAAEPYQRELAAYCRLAEHGVRVLCGHHVPELHDVDGERLVLEMTTVRRPFLLDFASARLDESPDFGDDVLSQWQEEKHEQFGKDWPRVEIILAALRRFGIHLLDINPGNISFLDPRQEADG